MVARNELIEPHQPVLREVMVMSSRSDMADAISRFLTAAGYDCAAIGNGANAIEKLLSIQPAFAIIDLSLPDDKGLKILELARKTLANTKFIAISADGSLGRAINAMKLDAYDYLPEPYAPSRLVTILQETLGEPDHNAPQTEMFGPHRTDFQNFIGRPEPMKKIYAAIEKAAKTSDSVFITGESSIGKEICAYAIHKCSPRRNQPFIAVNFAAIPKNLLESELFGHARGAFAGAVTDRAGLVTEAHGSTLFLDEICELAPAIQAKLLRLVEYGTFQRAGSNRLEKVDIRIVCATSCDPETELRKGRFLEDLLYRLQLIPIHLPPLHERKSDIIKIAEDFLFANSWRDGVRFENLTADAEEKQRSHEWPGNIRELQNALYAAFTKRDES